jgi:hypothetical protein
MNKSGIYYIKNLINSKMYIGSAINLMRRKSEHFTRLSKNKHHNQHLQNSWNLYGKNKFVFEIIEYCDKHILIKREQFFLDVYKTYDKRFGYNINLKAESSFGTKKTKKQIHNRLIKNGAKYFRVYNLNGKFIGEFLNKKECAKKLGLKNSSNITMCLNWTKKTLFNYIFIYTDELELLDDKFRFTVRETSRPFMVFDNTKIYGIFINQTECAELFNLSNKNISAVLNGSKKSHYGLNFEYLE